EKSVTTAVIEKDEPDPEPKEKAHAVKSSHESETEHEHHHMSGATKTLRIVAVAVAMFFSLMLAMTVGVGLALWDSNRTIAELGTIMFGTNVAAATYDQVPGDGDNTEATDESTAVSEAVADDAGSEESATEDEPEEEADYGDTLASEESSPEKADADDEIVGPEESDGPVALSDPLEDYPRPFTTVDESYFKDALFIGDSRLQGFGFWSGLPATYYCATGFHIYKYETTKVVQTENGKVPIFDAMPYDAFTKIYIKVGLNELGYGTEENFEQTYAQLIAKLREYEPRAIIYVHAILPVTAQKSETDKAHNNPNIVRRNAALKEFAKSQKAYFLDAGPVLSDDEGNLKPEMTSDGIHLKPEYMKIWREYLCEHAVQ
ncbi:MAG: hypothetical protein J5574_00795, partial [Lachnospiraceae bacterium]|nr:hypothetical protein [Lachnospiraceae bacterium]